MIDPKKLKEFGQELDEKSSGTSTFINASKIEGTLDFRILDPTPSLDGLYALEVVVWWVGKKKILSPTIFGGVDIPQQMIDEAKAQKDPELNKLLAATNDYGGEKLRKHIEYWIPGLVFDWDLEGDEIAGIWNEDNTPNVDLIDNFIRDKECKILTCKIQLMKAINRIATTRGGSSMFDRVNGFNLILGKTGEKRDTTYTALKDMALPMPEKYYGAGTLDVVDICKAGMFTDQYIDAIMGEYLYGEKLPEKTDDDYRYPEIRAALKNDEETEEKAPAARQRPGRAAQPVTVTAVDETPDTAPEEPQEEAPATEAPARPSRTARPATAADTAAQPSHPKRGGGRNVAADLKDV